MSTIEIVYYLLYFENRKEGDRWEVLRFRSRGPVKLLGGSFVYRKSVLIKWSPEVIWEMRVLLFRAPYNLIQWLKTRDQILRCLPLTKIRSTYVYRIEVTRWVDMTWWYDLDGCDMTMFSIWVFFTREPSVDLKGCPYSVQTKNRTKICLNAKPLLDLSCLFWFLFRSVRNKIHICDTKTIEFGSHRNFSWLRRQTNNDVISI